MSKHQLEDPEAEVAATLPRKKSKHHKHAKKDKSGSATATPTVEGSAIESEDTDVSREKKEKKDKKHKHHKHHHDDDERSESQANGVEELSSAPVNGASAEDESKEKKHKKNKKDKKEKKEKKRLLEEGNNTPEASEEQPKEKKHKKEKKQEEKADVVEMSNGTTDNGLANGQASGAASSTTYEQTAALTAVAEPEITKFLTDNEITITDPLSQHASLRPITQFSYLPSTTLTSKSPFAAFKIPTPIQAASWPFGLSGRDIVGVAETGSGKTIAFGLPLVEEVLKMPKVKKGTIRAVVVSPTRELAMQTAAELAKLGGMVGLKTVCVYGGAPKDDQRNQLRKADIIVATPGRLKDFLEEGSAPLGSAKFVVLDEADRMLDKGFEDDIKLIISKCATKSDRQTLMFTATWPESVRALASTFMNSPVRIQIGGNGSGDLQANTRIEQKVEVVDPREKEHRLLQILKEQPRNERIIVFCLYKKEATRVEEFLQRRGIKVVGIHGDLRQEQRTRSLDSFKKGENTVLVATDVAARGLDIPEVKLVINVTFPLTIEDYVHRIGRTGRAGKTGEAITLFTEHDKAHSGELVNILKKAGQPVPEDLMKFGTTVKKKQHSTYGAFFKDVDMTQKGHKITFD